MGAARKFLMLESCFDFSHKGGGLKEILYGNTFSVFDAFWVSMCKSLLFLVRLMGLFPNIVRVHSDNENSSVVSGKEITSDSSGYSEQKSNEFDVKEIDFHDCRDYIDDETEEDNESFDFPEDPLVSSRRRYEFISNYTVNGFVEEPKAVSFLVHHVYFGSDETEEQKTEDFLVDQQPKDSTEGFIIENKLEKSEDSAESLVVEGKVEKSEDLVTEEHVKEEMLVYEIVSCVGSKEVSVHESCVDGEEVSKTTENVLCDRISLSDGDEFIELTPEVENNSDVVQTQIDEQMGFCLDEFGLQEERQSMTSFEAEEEYYDDDDDDDDDDDLEHSEVVERLKMELKNARTGGLPTILEESETPLEEPKPLKIEANMEFKDRITEIQKVYKSYSIKMRKLDVLNTQTTHSISLLKLKDSTQLNGTDQDSSIRGPRSLNLWPFKKHQLKHDPIERLVKELGRDFETVYIGQLCLSWEMLHWQYMKAVEFHHHDPNGISQYNLVAGEFQLFQVLVQRFVENEPFQNCPRIENYLRNRRHFHNFLQVPLLRDDRSSRTNKCRNEGEFAISIEALREIIQESMRVFWEFIRTDKHEFISSFLKVSHQTQVSPQELLDLELFTDTRTDFEKKEKRLKEILRSEACIVKKLKKIESRSFRVKDELLIAQIELRLISRVMNMSKLTTDQLLWCREKLKKINFSSRKIHLEPSFSFFPR